MLKMLKMLKILHCHTDHVLVLFLTQDLLQLGKLCNIPDIISNPVNTDDMIHYYNTTTERDYRILQFFRGPGMHSTLCLPAPVLRSAATSVQPTMILAKIHKSQCQSVLEIGCAHGYCTLFLANLCPNVVFKGIDIVPRHIEIANQYRQDQCYVNTTFEICDAISIDVFEDETFDLIFAVEALCHLDTSAKRHDFLTCASKRLNKDGKIVIIDGFRSPTFAQSSTEQQRAMQIAEKGFRINEMVSKSAWKHLANDLNFEVLEDVDLTQEVLPFWQQGWRIARFILNFTYLLKCVGVFSKAAKQSSSNLLSIATTAHAFKDRGAAEYGMITLQKKA